MSRLVCVTAKTLCESLIFGLKIYISSQLFKNSVFYNEKMNKYYLLIEHKLLIH